MDPIQKTAIKETAKVFAGLLGIAILVPAVLFLVPFEILGTAAGVFVLSMAVKMIYEIKLAQAKFDAEYKKTVDQ